MSGEGGEDGEEGGGGGGAHGLPVHDLVLDGGDGAGVGGRGGGLGGGGQQRPVQLLLQRDEVLLHRVRDSGGRVGELRAVHVVEGQIEGVEGRVERGQQQHVLEQGGGGEDGPLALQEVHLAAALHHLLLRLLRSLARGRSEQPRSVDGVGEERPPSGLQEAQRRTVCGSSKNEDTAGEEERAERMEEEGRRGRTPPPASTPRTSDEGRTWRRVALGKVVRRVLG